MTRPTAPYTPADMLSIRSPWLRFKTGAAVRCACVFGIWKKGYTKAAANVEDMTMKDVYYWIYKSKRPITAKQTLGFYYPPQNTAAPALPVDFDEHSTLTLSAAGDILHPMHHAAPITTLYDNISDTLFESDISFANLESTITRQPLVEERFDCVSAPTECCSPEQFQHLAAVKYGGFTVLNIANNHSLDMGLEGLQTTQQTLQDSGILAIGANNKPEEHGKGRVIERKGIKVGLAAATFGTNGRKLPEGEAHRLNIVKLSDDTHTAPDLNLIKRQIDDCRSAGCDFVIVSLHWGHEFEFFPKTSQAVVAHALAEYGADAIIGHHPHVMQPVEYYQTKRDRHRTVVIAYSLGSLVWSYSAPHISLSGILQLTLAKGMCGGHATTYIKSAALVPVHRTTLAANGTQIHTIRKLDDDVSQKDMNTRRVKEYANLVLGVTQERRA